MPNEEDRMSSISKSSRFSAKSQVTIEAQEKMLAEQGGQITDMAKEMAAMKRLLVEAGIKPQVEDKNEIMEVDQVAITKKRMPSGSPEGKNWDETSSDSTGNDDDEEEEATNGISKDWRLSQLKKGKKETKCG